jgi:RNA polymerase sigma-70 factor, ECF subfamily
MTLALSMTLPAPSPIPEAPSLPASPGPPTVDKLAAEAQGGSIKAFEALVREAAPRVMRFLRRRLHDEHLAEDLTQDTFLHAHAGLASYDPKRPFLPWLFTIAFRLATDVQRSRAASARREKAVAADEVQPPPEMSDDGDVWLTAKTVLTEREYQAVWMRYAEDFEIPEVARAIGKSGVATRVMLLRARRKLQVALEKALKLSGSDEVTV